MNVILISISISISMRGRYFAVDEWKCSKHFYFLTHMHSDHTRGLSPTWHRGPVYCTSTSAALLLATFKGFDHALLHVLEVGVTTILSFPKEEDEPDDLPVLLEVTAIDAHHCPGAVMYLFRGDFGCVLHTGDFRWDVNLHGHSYFTERKQQLEVLLKGDRVDYLYLDNTFCSPCYSFPSRFEAARKVLDLINQHSNCDVVIGVDNLGKEELLLFIAATYRTKIWVWPERLLTMRVLGLPDVFTTDSTVTRIRAVPRYSVSAKTLAMLNRMHPTIAILPTGCLYAGCPLSDSKEEITCSEFAADIETDSHYGWTMELDITVHQTHDLRKLIKSLDSRNICSFNDNCNALEVQKGFSHNSFSSLPNRVHVVPYSLHACYAELHALVEYLHPLSVMGIVQSPLDKNTNPAYHFQRLLRMPQSNYTGLPEMKAKSSVVDCGFSGKSSNIASSFQSVTVSPARINYSRNFRHFRLQTNQSFTGEQRPFRRLRQLYARECYIRNSRKGGGTTITTL